MLLFFWCSLLIAPIARLGGGRTERVYKKSSSSSADTRSTFGRFEDEKSKGKRKMILKESFKVGRETTTTDRRQASSEEKFEVEIEIFKLKKCDGQAQPLEPPTIFNAFFTFLYLLQIFFSSFFGCFVCLCVLCVIFSLSFLLEFHFIYIIFVRWIFNFIYIYIPSLRRRVSLFFSIIIPIFLLFLFRWSSQINGAGFFELRILEISNKKSHLKDGSCCGSYEKSKTVGCSPCKTAFRLCLGEETVGTGCPFGEKTTEVLGGSSFELDDRRNANNITVPFTFRWTVSRMMEGKVEKDTRRKGEEKTLKRC